ncbi:TetR/AcrR family transcriptional regulator [Pelosinus sp. IPA-1]|uniref:TetR/AcrR family transcriptional regulator n=1 Tax=Pelosinus sp. IPA-1 TaxID=3029569 RepID=UPI0024362A92|nr:TetR/AcrR family transcriptional regulator [Pelosinus sp. IPA-1]GMA99961.1 hypothetical protein PIPA1_27610 [Pelosinus sp. IPA-1]
MENLFVHEGKKGVILKTSLELFAAKGYNAVSVRDIAKAAGVSEAALYKHFKGKEDMALYIFSAIISEYTRQLAQVDARDDKSVNKLCKIVEVTYDLYRKYPNEIQFALLSQYFLWDMVPEEIKPHFIIRKIIDEGMKRGDIPIQDVYLWITIYTGIMLQPLAQYPYFHDVLPEFDILKAKIISSVRKLFS